MTTENRGPAEASTPFSLMAEPDDARASALTAYLGKLYGRIPYSRTATFFNRDGTSIARDVHALDQYQDLISLICDVESRRGAVDVPGFARRVCCHSFEPVSAFSVASAPFPLPARRTVREDFPHTALPSGFVLKGYDSYHDGDAARK